SDSAIQSKSKTRNSIRRFISRRGFMSRSAALNRKLKRQSNSAILLNIRKKMFGLFGASCKNKFVIKSVLLTFEHTLSRRRLNPTHRHLYEKVKIRYGLIHLNPHMYRML